MLKDVKANHTDTTLTEDNIEPSDEFGLGFIKARCSRCEANLYLSERGIVTCLNGCHLSEQGRRALRGS